MAWDVPAWELSQYKGQVKETESNQVLMSYFAAQV